MKPAWSDIGSEAGPEAESVVGLMPLEKLELELELECQGMLGTG